MPLLLIGSNIALSLEFLCVVCVCVDMAPKKRFRAAASSSELVLDRVVMATDTLRTEFGKQQARVHCRPRWYDKETGLKLNIDSTLSRMFGELGASSLLMMRYLSYQALTSEFLSSLSMDFEADTITFQLGNETRSMTLAEFNCKTRDF